MTIQPDPSRRLVTNPAVIPIFDLEREATVFELIDAVRESTKDQFLITLRGQIERDGVLQYNRTVTAPSKRDSFDEYTDHDAGILNVAFNLIHQGQGASKKTLELIIQEIEEVP